MAVFELIGDLSKLFGKEIFTKHLESIFLSYMSNTAASVRDMGIKKTRELAEKFKSEWILSAFIPRVTEIYNVDKQGYNYRMCCLHSLNSVTPYLSKDQVTQHVVPIFVKAMRDPIPNVRFTVNKIIRSCKPFIDGGILSAQIIPVLKEMVASDSDRDVQYYATLALNEN